MKQAQSIEKQNQVLETFAKNQTINKQSENTAEEIIKKGIF